MKKQPALIVAGAPIQLGDALKKQLKNYPFIVAADRGLDTCLSLGIEPDFAVGDFDSCLQKKDYDPAKCLVFPKHKNETDLELAVFKVRNLGFEKIFILAGLGADTRHSLANLILAARFPLTLFFETETEWVFAIDRHVRIKTCEGQLISLFPLISTPKVTTKGLKWELHEKLLDQQFLSVSNESLSSEVELFISDGPLICCVEKKTKELDLSFITD